MSKNTDLYVILLYPVSLQKRYRDYRHIKKIIPYWRIQMTIEQDKASSTNSAKSKVYSMMSGKTWEQFVNYKPDKNRDQHFEAARDGGRRRHNSIDYSSPLGSDVIAPMDMKVTLIKNYYPDSKGNYDCGLRVSAIDPNGNRVEYTIGHLSPKSMQELFGTNKLVNGQSINVKGGTVIGQVSYQSQVGRNVYHFHVGPMRVNGKLVNPLDYFRTLTPQKGKTSANQSINDPNDVQLKNAGTSNNNGEFQANKSLGDKLSEELNSLIKLGLEGAGQEELSEKNAPEVVVKLLGLGVSKSLIRQALNDQLCVNNANAFADEGDEKIGRIIKAAEQDQGMNAGGVPKANESRNIEPSLA
jgi:hypothetical protein